MRGFLLTDWLSDSVYNKNILYEAVYKIQISLDPLLLKTVCLYHWKQNSISS